MEDSRNIIVLELVLVFGAVVTFCVYQLWTLKKDGTKKRDE